MNDIYKNKVVLVTGASRGIGKAIAMRFVSQGAYVIATATTQDSLKNITDDLDKNNFSGMGFVLNVADKSSVEDFERKNHKNVQIQILAITVYNALLLKKPQKSEIGGHYT